MKFYTYIAKRLSNGPVGVKMIPIVSHYQLKVKSQEFRHNVHHFNEDPTAQVLIVVSVDEWFCGKHARRDGLAMQRKPPTIALSGQRNYICIFLCLSEK